MQQLLDHVLLLFKIKYTACNKIIRIKTKFGGREELFVFFRAERLTATWLRGRGGAGWKKKEKKKKSQGTSEQQII